MLQSDHMDVLSAQSQTRILLYTSSITVHTVHDIVLKQCAVEAGSHGPLKLSFSGGRLCVPSSELSSALRVRVIGRFIST